MPTEGFKWLSKRQPYLIYGAIVVQKAANERRYVESGGGGKNKTKITARLYFGPISKFVMCLDAVQDPAHADTYTNNTRTHRVSK